MYMCVYIMVQTIPAACHQRLWSYDLTALYKSIIIIIIIIIITKISRQVFVMTAKLFTGTLSSKFAITLF